MKKIFRVGALSIISLLITLGCYAFRLYTARQSELGTLLFEITKGMQIRQMLCVLSLFILGISFLYCFANKWDLYLKIILALPIGIAVWGSLSCIILISPLEYNGLTMLLVCTGFELFFLLWKRNKKNTQRNDRNKIIMAGMIALSVLCIASTGLFYTFSSHDTVYYIEFLGKEIAMQKGLTQDFSTYLLHTGIGIATLSALSDMWNVDTIYILHHSVVIAFFSFCGYMFYRKASESTKKKPALWSAFITVVLLFFLPPVRYLSGFVISNTYIMIYLFIIVMLLAKIKAQNTIPSSYGMVLSLLFFFMSFVRMDAGITICCIYACIATTAICNRDIIIYCIIPGLLGTLGLFAKYIGLFGTDLDGMLLNYNTLLAICGLYICVLCFFCFFRHRKYDFTQKNFPGMIGLGMILVTTATFLYSPSDFIENLETYMYNFTEISVAGGFWGTAFIFLIVLWWVVHYVNGTKLSFLEITILLLVVVTINMGNIRSMIGVSPRRGYGDSFNREFISYVPLLMYAIYEGVFQYRNKRVKCNKQ